MIFLIMLVIGIIHIKYYENTYTEQYNLSEINEEAVVISEAKESKYKNKYTIKTNNKKYIIELNKAEEILEYGDLIKIEGEYQKPQISRNYKGFDYSKYLKSKNIYGIIKASRIDVVEKHYINVVFELINKFRNIIIGNLQKVIEDENASGLLIGILIGDTDYMDEEITQNFKNSSLAHVLAVSGQHISYVILAISFALRISKLGRRLSNFLSILILCIFIMLTQMTPSVLRAGIMGMLIIASKLVHRKSDIYTNLAISIIIILFINPFIIYDIGLWLSYGGTLGIVLLNKKTIVKLENTNCLFEFIKGIFTMTLSAQIFILPIMILNFNQFSTMFWLSNILASPLVGIIIIYGFIIFFSSLLSIEISIILSFPLKFLLRLLMFISKMISDLKFSKLLIVTLNPIFVIVYYFIIFLIIYKKCFKKHIVEKKIIKILKIILISICIVSLIFQFIDFTKNELKIFFIDVGQGDSSLIITPSKKSILIDGGGSESYDVGKNILLPYLLDRGIMRLDYVIISHFDTDHVRWYLYNYGRIKYRNSYNKQANAGIRKL